MPQVLPPSAKKSLPLRRRVEGEGGAKAHMAHWPLKRTYRVLSTRTVTMSTPWYFWCDTDDA